MKKLRGIDTRQVNKGKGDPGITLIPEGSSLPKVLIDVDEMAVGMPDQRLTPQPPTPGQVLVMYGCPDISPPSTGILEPARQGQSHLQYSETERNIILPKSQRKQVGSNPRSSSELPLHQCRGALTKQVYDPYAGRLNTSNLSSSGLRMCESA